MAYRYPYRIPARYRYPYRGRKAGGAEKAVGLALGAILAASLGGKAAATAVHHHAAHHAAPVTVAAVPVAGASETAFIGAVLADLGAPATGANITSLASWFPHEFPSWPPYAANNPMASTMQMPGSTTYNGVGVQNYPNPSEGAQATALTLEDGWYPNIVAALRSGAGLCGNSSITGELSTWSGGGYSGVC